MRSNAVLAVLFGTALGNCKSCHPSSRDQGHGVDEGANDPAEADDNRDNYWRVRIVIAGAGDASTSDKRLYCHGTPTAVTGACGPLLLRFTEPLVHAIAAPRWHFAHWRSMLTEPDGSTHPRAGKLPDGALYLNGLLGYGRARYDHGRVHARPVAH